MNILTNLVNLLVSPRFKAFYWNMFGMVIGGFLTLLANNLTGLGLSVEVAIILGGILTQISKAIVNWANDKPMGFAPKK